MQYQSIRTLPRYVDYWSFTPLQCSPLSLSLPLPAPSLMSLVKRSSLPAPRVVCMLASWSDLPIMCPSKFPVRLACDHTSPGAGSHMSQRMEWCGFWGMALGCAWTCEHVRASFALLLAYSCLLLLTPLSAPLASLKPISNLLAKSMPASQSLTPALAIL